MNQDTTLTDLAILLNQHHIAAPSTSPLDDWYTCFAKEPNHRYTLEVPISMWEQIRSNTDPRQIRRYFLSAARHKLADPNPADVLDAARELLPLLERIRPQVFSAATGGIAEEEYDELLEAIRHLLKS